MFKKIMFLSKTFEGAEVEFNIKSIKRIHLNYVTIKWSYINWLKTGKIEEKEYELTPESLRSLIALIESNRNSCSASVNSAKHFLTLFPTLESLKKSIEENEKLPIDY